MKTIFDFSLLAEWTSSNPTTVLSTNVVGSFLALLLLALVYRSAKKGEAWHIELILLVLGGLAGWCIGMIAAPYNETEAEQFTSIAKIVSVFISGYLVSKIDRFIEECLFKESVTSKSVQWTRAAMFTCAFLIGFVIVFTNRKYYHDLPSPRKESITPSSPQS